MMHGKATVGLIIEYDSTIICAIRTSVLILFWGWKRRPGSRKDTWRWVTFSFKMLRKQAQGSIRVCNRLQKNSINPIILRLHYELKNDLKAWLTMSIVSRDPISDITRPKRSRILIPKKKKTYIRMFDEMNTKYSQQKGMKRTYEWMRCNGETYRKRESWGQQAR